jgi:hypothetical protein
MRVSSMRKGCSSLSQVTVACGVASTQQLKYAVCPGNTCWSAGCCCTFGRPAQSSTKIQQCLIYNTTDKIC